MGMASITIRNLEDDVKTRLRLSQTDGQIAAIARSRAMAVATRSVRDFSGTGIEVIDPWTEA